jgi:uncharacterized protein YndB with AHSA1/START domain
MTQTHIEISDTTRLVRLQRRLDCQPYRAYRAWSSPDALTTWFPEEVEGSLSPGARSTLVFPSQRVWWDVLEAEPENHFLFRWPWLEHGDLVTTVKVTVTPRGYGSLVTVEDGPFDLTQPGVVEAYADCLSGWGEALANLRAVMDFSVDLRRYRSG